MKPVLWAELPIHDLQARRDDGVDLVLIPVGGTAPHGTHLPTGTDAMLVETLCYAISSRTAIPVLPTISFGATRGNGALKIAPTTLISLINDVAESVLEFGMKRIVILSGNDENLPAIECALQTLRAQHPDFLGVAHAIWDATPQTRQAWHNDATKPHAGLAETALMHYLAPQLVGNVPSHIAPEKERVFFAANNDVCGAANEANAQLGAELFEALVSGWTRLVKRALIENHATQISQMNDNSQN